MTAPAQSVTRRIVLAVGLLLICLTVALIPFGWLSIVPLLGLAACLVVFFRLPAQPQTVAAPAAPAPAPTNDTDDALYRSLPDLIWVIDYGTRAVTALNNACTPHHPSADTADGTEARLASLLPARISRQYLEALIAVQSSNQPQHFEYRLSNNDKEGRVFEARLQPRSLKECVAVIRDITQLKTTEEALFNQQLFVHQIIDSSPNLIFVRDKHGRFLLVNRATQTTLGHELLVQSHMGLEETQLPFTTGDKEVLEDGQTIRVVDHWTLPNGRTHWFDITKQPLVREGDIYILSIAIDISHVKAAEAALSVTDPLAGDVADSLPIAFMLVRDGIVEFANSRACEQLNIPPADLLGRPLSAITPSAAMFLAGEHGDFVSSRSGRHWPCQAKNITQGERTALLLVFDSQPKVAQVAA
ncbi:PAS domain-containing protein [Andreprevotia chitinilytica]|uniref:PAS domain-containing protein n=1 Tax=Andreprevotia chitinilytica TaxID=396808 RepID=UPI0005584B05|nr:PAS domain-containing protein [Andreprevotia chitinilytica]